MKFVIFHTVYFLYNIVLRDNNLIVLWFIWLCTTLAFFITLIYNGTYMYEPMATCNQLYNTTLLEI